MQAHQVGGHGDCRRFVRQARTTRSSGASSGSGDNHNGAGCSAPAGRIIRKGILMIMNQDKLRAQYRNLLVQLARDAVCLGKEITDIRLALRDETDLRRKRGMQTIINCRNRTRSRLLQLISRNKHGCIWFFGTADPEKISQEKIASNHE